jgi:hypothetical protein
VTSEERKDMRSEYVVAIVSVIIALLGIVGTLVVTDRQEAAEADRARQEFVRSQRREAYAALLSTVVEYEEQRDRFVDSVVELTPQSDVRELHQGYSDYAVAYDELVLAIHTVKMTGSDGMLQPLDDVQAAHDQVHAGIGTAMELVREGNQDELLTSTIRQAMNEGFTAELAPVPAAMDEFIRHARTDLGLNR